EVFSEYLEHKPDVPLDDVIDKLLVNERIAEAQTFKFLADSGIPSVNPLANLKKNIAQGLYARSAGDMHPNKNGYHVIAESIAEVLKQDAGKQPAAAAQQYFDYEQ